MPRNKHVIILGAGASVTSGYPMARQLTKLMADRIYFRRYLDDLIRREEHDAQTEHLLVKLATGQFHAFESVSRLLKLGSFATMDELSNLAFGGERAGDILQLKRWLRYILGLGNPQTWHWGSSDYPPFVNALFQGNEIPREDVCVLSFNYDPYLEYLLMAALEARHSLRVIDADRKQYFQQAATSGLFDPTDLSWLSKDGFSHLKLHGAVVFPATQARIDNKILTWGHLIAREMVTRCMQLKELGEQDPPVLLPWEIIHPKGARLLTEAEFKETVGTNWEHASLFPLFEGIWRPAKNEIRTAHTVSFVGISMGKFLDPEMRFLFSDVIAERPQVVVVNPSNKHTRPGATGIPLDRYTPAGKTYYLLRDIFTDNMQRTGVIIPRLVAPPIFGEHGAFRWLLGFDEFIEREMG